MWGQLFFYYRMYIGGSGFTLSSGYLPLQMPVVFLKQGLETLVTYNGQKVHGCGNYKKDQYDSWHYHENHQSDSAACLVGFLTIDK